jgi:hypothetical protein
MPSNETTLQHIGKIIVDRADKEKGHMRSVARYGKEQIDTDIQNASSLNMYASVMDAYDKLIQGKESYLVSFEELKDGVKGIPHEVILQSVDDYDIEDHSEFNYAMSQLRDMQELIFDEEGVDIVCILQNALDGITSAVNKLKVLTEEYYLGDMLKDILSYGDNVYTRLNALRMA